jgi:hypothetical protein
MVVLEVLSLTPRTPFFSEESKSPSPIVGPQRRRLPRKVKTKDRGVSSSAEAPNVLDAESDDSDSDYSAPGGSEEDSEEDGTVASDADADTDPKADSLSLGDREKKSKRRPDDIKSGQQEREQEDKKHETSIDRESKESKDATDVGKVPNAEEKKNRTDHQDAHSGLGLEEDASDADVLSVLAEDSELESDVDGKEGKQQQLIDDVRESERAVKKAKKLLDNTTEEFRFQFQRVKDVHQLSPMDLAMMVILQFPLDGKKIVPYGRVREMSTALLDDIEQLKDLSKKRLAPASKAFITKTVMLSDDRKKQAWFDLQSTRMHFQDRNRAAAAQNAL